MSFWEELVAFWGLGTAGLAIIGFIAKSIIKYWLEKDLNTFKANLEKESFEHQVRFGKLHEERARAIQELHNITIPIEDGLRELYNKYYPIGDYEPEVDEKEVTGKIVEFRDLFKKYRIYFGKELIEIIESLTRKYAEAERVLRNQSVRIKISNGELNQNEVIPPLPDPEEEKPYLLVETESNIVRDKLEDEFRNILGVE